MGGSLVRAHLHRSRRGAVTGALVLILVVVPVVGVWAAFSGTTSNTTNELTAASFAITDDDAGAALVTLPALQPGDSDTRCITITHSGTGNARVVSYGDTTGSGLDPYIGLTVTRGTMPPGNFSSCTGFTPDNRVYLRDAPQGVVYVGTLADYPDNATTALHENVIGGRWAPGESHTFKIHLYTGRARAGEGKSATQTFTWAAVADPSEYDNAVLAEAPDVVSYWRLNERSGEAAADSVGSNHGAYVLGPGLGQPGPLRGSFNTGVTFDGVNDHIMIDGPVGLATQQFTIEAWFRTTASGSERIIYRSRYGGNILRINANGTVGADFYDTAAAFHPISSASAFNDGLWHHAAYTKGAGGTRLYVDGQLVASDAATIAVDFTANPRVAIGRDGDGDVFYFNGAIDDVAYYSVALTQTRIQAHYDAR